MSLVIAFVDEAANGIANWSNLLPAGVNFADDEEDADESSVVVDNVRGVGVGLLANKMNFASGSFVVLESHTKPGVMFPFPVNDGRTFRSKRKRSASQASERRFSTDEASDLIE